MLRARNQSAKGETLEALTVSGTLQDGVIKTLYALGFDKVIRAGTCSGIVFSHIIQLGLSAAIVMPDSQIVSF